MAASPDALVQSQIRSVASKPTRTRWWILILISMMYLICYMDRSNISVAQPEIAKQFHLSKSAMGLVLAAFTWAYALGQVPAGWLGDHFGAKKVLTVIMSWWSVAAMMTGAAVGLVSLFGARFLLGVGEAGAFPVASRGMWLWFPRAERGRIQGVTHFFSRFAVAVTPFVAGSIMIAFGWRALFYIFGSLGVLWAIVFSLLYRDRPEDDKSVNAAELAVIRGVDSFARPALERQPAPWRRILLAPNMWFVAVGYACFFFGTNFYLTWYPTYLREHRHLSLTSLGFWGSLPLFAGMAGDIFGGALSDRIFKRTNSARLARRVVAAPGFLLAGLFLIRRPDLRSCHLNSLSSCLLLFPRMGHRSGMGRSHGHRRPVQWNSHGHYEYDRRLGGIFGGDRLWNFVRPGFVGYSVLRERRRSLDRRPDLDLLDRSREICC